MFKKIEAPGVYIVSENNLIPPHILFGKNNILNSNLSKNNKEDY